METGARRPSPDEILAKLKAEEARLKRGKLKIFLGYAAGVGKTYTMLDAARNLKKEIDVVVGYVETHERAETEALLEGLEIVPRRLVEYRGVKLAEMDLDAVLKRHPKLALVDELAHENAPDSRHPKRYLDIVELLDDGIDVYTTLNVQHIESVRDVVAQVTGVWIRETVPDSFIDEANEIEIVDLPPDELVKRLREGKVYVPAQIAPAIEQFFRVGNLTALRELAMRSAAKHVDEKTLAYMREHDIAGPWPTGERLLVCLIPGYSGNRLVRSARRLANELSAEWTVLYVNTPEHKTLPQEQQDQIESNLRMAERLGARTATIQAETIPTTVIEYARKNNITKILLGKSQRGRRRTLFQRSITGQIARLADQFDVMITGGGVAEPDTTGGIFEREIEILTQIPGTWRRYLQALGILVIATLLGQTIYHIASPTTVVMLYLLCTVISAYFWGPGPTALVTVLGVILFAYFYVPPFYSFRGISDTQYLFTLISLLGVGFIISYLSSRLKQQADVIRHREHQTTALFALGKDLALANDLGSYIHAIIKRSRETFDREAVIFLPGTDKYTLQPHADGHPITLGENDIAAAEWAFEHQKIVGHGTDTLPNARARFLPLITSRGIVGVIAFVVSESAAELSEDQLRLLEAFADLSALALESILAGQSREIFKS